MKNTRKALYNKIFNAVKDSPVKTVEFQGNVYHFKCEYLLPYGECQYSRIFAKLIYLKECLGLIKSGDVLVETTSGSGGRAAAAVATALGYRIKIAIPAGGEKAREDAIVRAGGELYLTPKEAYINGFPEFVRTFLTEHPGAVYVNHAMGDIHGRGDGINGAALNAFRPFMDEVLEAGIAPDVVFCPLGNGTTTLPMVTGFKSLFRKVVVIGFESVLSGYCHTRLYPGKYERIFGVDPKTLPRHDLPGTTPAHTVFLAPAIEAATPLLDGIALVTSNFTNEGFFQTTGYLPSDKSDWVVKWDDYALPFLSDFGRTGKAGFATAVKYAEKEGLQGKHFLIPVFDAAWHYDT